MRYFSRYAVVGLAIPATILSLAGCRSVSSTIMDRTPSDNLLAESNGERCHFEQGAPYRGIPVVVKVPTHLDVSITETLLFTEIKNGSGNPTLIKLNPSKRQIGVNATLSSSDKLFFVDFKRPASGTLDYTIDYGDGKSQYFKTIKYKAVDETINDINGALSTLFGLPAPSAQATKQSTAATQADANGKKNDPTFSSSTRTLAWKRFDINEPDFENQMTEFVNLHLNNCNDCGPCSSSTVINVYEGN